MTAGRVRVGVLISGRGSNMEALIAAAGAPDYPAEITLVLSNRADAPGLATAQAAGITAFAIDHRPFGKDREAHERALDAEIRARFEQPHVEFARESDSDRVAVFHCHNLANRCPAGLRFFVFAHFRHLRGL